MFNVNVGMKIVCLLYVVVSKNMFYFDFIVGAFLFIDLVMILKLILKDNIFFMS